MPVKSMSNNIFKTRKYKKMMHLPATNFIENESGKNYGNQTLR